MQSLSDDIRKDAASFDEKAPAQLRSLQQRIIKGSFQFPLAKGVLKKRPGKTPRPLVVAPLISRIVQRSILNTLWDIEPVKVLSTSVNSFGGMEGGKVKGAIENLCMEIHKGARYYFKSDIKDFFTKIPKDIVLSEIDSVLPDNSIQALLRV